MSKRHYDFVIVGGGSAGSALANRLSADPGTSVLVLEAGHSDFIWDPLIHMPAALSMPIGNPRYDWRYITEPDPSRNGRRDLWPRGKVLGGSSSINAMVYMRGQASDYDSWAANGNPSWTEYICENTTMGTNSGWILETHWDSINLTPGTSYKFTVKSRNAEGVENDWVSLQHFSIYLPLLFR